MATLVLKFGGTSVATIPAIENVANKVAAEMARGGQEIEISKLSQGDHPIRMPYRRGQSI